MTSHPWEPIPRTYDPLKAGSIDGTDTIPHDHGIVRAMQLHHIPMFELNVHARLFFVSFRMFILFYLSLFKIFSHCGEIKRLRVIRDIVTGFSKGYAFIEFYDKYDAVRARRDIDHTVIEDKEVLVDFECERILKGWVPRRLGKIKGLRFILIFNISNSIVLISKN
ncbi:unnamed protein product [Larinioides sclopetarius]|uniref:RRM domain-containing protein n=1 Tax=Larinioides sclopetarius TaxID=280406 RepID=A0AAV2AKC9_9ARAC